MIDTEAITEEPSLEQEDGEQAPDPQQETQQSQAPESPQEPENTTVTDARTSRC